MSGLGGLTLQWHSNVGRIYMRKTLDDAFFGQGFAAARDRLWQIDWDRRRALGRIAQLRGGTFVAADQARRLFLYRGDAASEWTNYQPLTHSIAIAFTAGVNSYVELARDKPDLLPVEFKQAGYLSDYPGKDPARFHST
jgi:penicillin G amidase